MKERKGILLDTFFDLLINPTLDSEGLIRSGFTIGNSEDQEVALVLGLNQGELKEDPLLGPGLNKFIRGKHNAYSIETKIKQHLSRIGIDYSEYKEKISINIKTE